MFFLSSFVVLPQLLGQPISTQHLVLDWRKLSLAGFQTSTKRSGCVLLLLCKRIICQCNEKLCCFFHGSKYENTFCITALWQSQKLTHVTICVNSSFTSSHCGQKLLRTEVLTGRNTTEKYHMSFLFFQLREGREY